MSGNAATIIVTADGALAGDTSVPITPMTVDLPEGTELGFGDGKTATLSAPALEDDETLAVDPLAQDLAPGDECVLVGLQSFTGSWVLQQAIVQALRADATVTRLLKVNDADTAQRIYDALPEGLSEPYVVVGEGTETDASTFGQMAHEVMPSIEVWTRDGETANRNSGASGYRLGLRIADAIVGVLLDDAFTVDGHDVVVMPVQEMTKDRPSADDPSLRVVSPKFKVLLEDSEE